MLYSLCLRSVNCALTLPKTEGSVSAMVKKAFRFMFNICSPSITNLLHSMKTYRLAPQNKFTRDSGIEFQVRGSLKSEKKLSY